jgi:uncharacterized membrane protein
VQGFRIAGYMHEKNSKDLKIRQDAREGVRAGIIIIAVTALMAGVGMSAIFFFLNKFLGA